MSDNTGGRGEGGRAMGRSKPAHRARNDQSEISSSFSGGRGVGDTRRPGSSSQPSTSSDVGRTQRQEQVRGPPRPAQTSPSHSSTGEGAPTLGRGAMRGRRVISQDIERMTRPTDLKSKKGLTGMPIRLTSNYFKLLSTPDWCLHQYRVDFAPEEERTMIKKSLLRDLSSTLGSYVFDGSVLYTTTQLPKVSEYNVKKRDDTTVIISVKYVLDIPKTDYHYLQFFNILMRKCLASLNLQLVGRNYFDAHAKVEIKDYKLELWPGYETTIRQHENDILLCADIAHKVMRQETLLDLAYEIYDRDQMNYQNLFKNEVIGTVVLTGYNNRTYRIDDVDFEGKPQDTFKTKTGEDISYVDYYFKQYKITIREADQPLLISRPKDRDRRGGMTGPIVLIPELCRRTGLTDSMRANFRLMQALAKYTRVTPADRSKKLQTFNRRLHSEPRVVKEFKDWNLELDRDLVQIQGRVIPPDDIVTGGDQKHKVADNADWTMPLRKARAIYSNPLKEWIVICTQRDQRPVQGFVDMMIKNAQAMSFHITTPTYHNIPNDNAQAYTQALDEIKSKLNPQLIFCSVSNNRADRYSAIKKKCCVERPVPTQVATVRNMTDQKKAMSIATKIAIQINCKNGGIPWSLSIPVKGLMVVGFDVCHDTNVKGKDFGAMVASLDPNFGRYFSAVSAHQNGEELSRDFSVNLCKALEEFKKCSADKAYPKKIIIYRDGVGNGDIPYILDQEVKQIIEKLSVFYNSSEEVPLTFIIVTKRITTRFFAGERNPPPGTVVDDVVTDPNKYDFFIVSQHVGQGTVSPTAYNVVYDKAGLDADKLHRLSYKLCHMYYNWSGTVRVPAPCQYAHKLAFLVSQSIHQPPNPMLQSVLYFL